MTLDTITLVANVALTLSFIVALIFGVAQVRAAARDRRERLTLEALRGFQTREYAELIQFVVSHEMPATRKDFDALPVSDQVLFLQVSQSMVMLGLLVAEHYIDADLVERTLGTFVTTAWEKLQTMVLALRPTDPYMNEYLQWLADGIGRRMSQRPRKPFYQTNAPLS